jgi:hypothetical protein
MKKIEAKVLLSSGSTIQWIEYNFEIVESFSKSTSYYYIRTPDGEYYLPIDRTIIKRIEK